MSTRHNKSLWLLVSALIVAAALFSLVFTAFNDALVYFYTPTELKEQSTTLSGKKIRIGGMVQQGSLVRDAAAHRLSFLITDGKDQVPVRYAGPTPDLFREGQGVIAEGIWQPDQPFAAETILAKHSEDYVPVEMSDEGIAKAKESLLKSLQ
jgi:cytochrome c-type biogenesis protein CcmE